MKASYTLLALVLAFASSPLTAQTSTKHDLPATPNTAGAEVRIVRLSQVEGKAQMDRGVGAGFEIAFANLPVTQGSKLQTLDGTAEVEFEDNSTLRLTPGTLVEFTTLDRNSSGITNSTIRVIRGTVYADLQRTKGNIFALGSEAGTAFLSPHSSVRLTSGSVPDDLSVFEGVAAFQSPEGAPVPVGKMSALLLDPALQAKESFVTKLVPGPYDSWEQSGKTFHEEYSKAVALSGSPNLYGTTDLNYYGSFADLPGCGRVWRPYFASAKWDPYSNGVWAWYPTSGYSWVSAYPWGWAPFHYGAWQQCSAGVWGWAPGGTWKGLNNVQETVSPSSQHAPAQPGSLLHPNPVQPKTANARDIKMFFASDQPFPISGMNPSTHAFIFRIDSAGIGIPRQTFGDLGKLSATAQGAGSAVVPMYAIVSWTVRPGSDGKSQPQRTPVTTWVPANDPRLQQTANNTNSKDRIAKSNHGDLLPSDSGLKAKPPSEAAVVGASISSMPTRQRSSPTPNNNDSAIVPTAMSTTVSTVSVIH